MQPGQYKREKEDDPGKRGQLPSGALRLRPKCAITGSDYKRAVSDLKHYIERGYTYVGNLTQRIRVRTGWDPRAAYRILRESSPAPYSAYLDGGSWKVLCSSMERFVKSDGSTMETRPIKGTRKRGATPEEDVADVLSALYRPFKFIDAI